MKSMKELAEARPDCTVIDIKLTDEHIDLKGIPVVSNGCTKTILDGVSTDGKTLELIKIESLQADKFFRVRIEHRAGGESIPFSNYADARKIFEFSKKLLTF